LASCGLPLHPLASLLPLSSPYSLLVCRRFYLDHPVPPAFSLVGWLVHGFLIPLMMEAVNFYQTTSQHPRRQSSLFMVFLFFLANMCCVHTFNE
jgi:hypothetical protein